MSRVRRRPHDPFLKLLYRAGAGDAITLFFPELAAHIDWERLQWIEKEILIPGEEARSIVADLVGTARDREGRYLEVLIHPEIQMRPDAEMDWRAFQYSAGLMLQRGRPDVRVLTFVFYHYRGAGGIRRREYRLEFYDELPHQMNYWTVGLGDLDAEEYAIRDNPMAWALAAWMRQRRAKRVELRLRLLDKVLRFVQDLTYRRLLLDTLRSYFALNSAEQAEEARLLQSGAFAEVREMLDTELGRLEAAAELRGRCDALRRVFQGIVADRFSGVSERFSASVDRVQDPAALERLIRRAAVAESLEEIERLLSPQEE